MADPKNKEDSQPTDEKKQAKTEVTVACEISLTDIVAELHKNAKEKAEQKFSNIKIINSAIEGEGKNAKLHSAGHHIVSVCPIEGKITKEEAKGPLQMYIQWFVGPDLKSELTDDKIWPLEDEESNKSANESVNVLTFNQFLKESGMLLEVTDEQKQADPDMDDEEVTASNDQTDAEIKKGNNDEEGSNEETGDEGSETAADSEAAEKAKGWYVTYELLIEGIKETPLKDAVKSFMSGLLDTVGIKKVSFGGAGELHTIGQLRDEIDKVFGKIDPDKLKASFDKEIKKKLPQTQTSSDYFDKNTIQQYLKKDLESKDKAKIRTADYSFCVKVPHNDKSQKLVNTQVVADMITRSIQGLFKKFKNKVKKEDVILVNNYSENDKDKDKAAKKLEVKKSDESVKTNYHSSILLSEAGEDREEDNEKNTEIDTAAKLSEMEKGLQDLAKAALKDDFSSASILKAEEMISFLQKKDINEPQLESALKKHLYAFLVVSDEELSEDKEKTKANASQVTKYSSLLQQLFESVVDKPANIDIVKKIFKDLIAKFEDYLPNKDEKVNYEAIDSLIAYTPDVEEKTIKTEKAEESLNSGFNILSQLFEDLSYSAAKSLLLEGHCEEWLDLMKEIKEIGADAFNVKGKKDKKTKKRGPDAAEKLRAAYEKHLVDAKKDKKYADSDYTKRIDTSSKNWVNKSLISSLHADPENPITKDKLIAKFEEAFKGRNRDTSDERPEIYALLQALKDIKKDLPKPEPEKKEPEPEKTEEHPHPEPEPIPPAIEEFEYKFFDYDPANPDDDDPEELKSGKVEKGGSVTPPESPKHDDFEFIGWKPEEFDNIEKPMVYVAQYDKAKPSIFPVVFYDFDFDAGTAVAIDTQYIEKGKGATAPAEPNHEDIGWKFTGWDTKFDNVTEPLDVMAEYQNLIKIQPKFPKDPAKPDDLELSGEPFELDPEKPVKEQLPEHPEKDGYEPDGWEPDPEDFDPNSVEDPKDPVVFVGKYKKVAPPTPGKTLIYYVVPDENDILKDKNDVKVGRNQGEYDFYIVPMKGLSFDTRERAAADEK